MIRTINEHHRASRLLREKAKLAPIGRRERLLQLARADLLFAMAQLRNPSLRPNIKLRLSADQYRAIAECLLANPETAARGRWFAGMIEIAELSDWPSSCTAPFELLTKEESSAIWNGPFPLRQRVFAPTLTKTEQASLRQNAKELHDWAQKAWPLERPIKAP